MYIPVDPATPRYQLPFEQLPRGFVPWPKEYVEALEREEKASQWGRYGEEYRIDSLTISTLRHYYQGYFVAYRPAEGGIEVLAVGAEEITPYLQDQRDPTIIVDQG